MGNGTFDVSSSAARATYRSTTGTSAFRHDTDARMGRAPKLHETLDFTKKPQREARDNPDSPNFDDDSIKGLTDGLVPLERTSLPIETKLKTPSKREILDQEWDLLIRRTILGEGGERQGIMRWSILDLIWFATLPLGFWGWGISIFMKTHNLVASIILIIIGALSYALFHTAFRDYKDTLKIDKKYTPENIILEQEKEKVTKEFPWLK